ncbi:MAG TPA: hypothetical protein VIJ14_08695, partial [Rhabdochlamydiaceae bacterium]
KQIPKPKLGKADGQTLGQAIGFPGSGPAPAPIAKSKKLCKMHKSQKLCTLHKSDEVPETTDSDNDAMAQDGGSGQPHHDCPMCQELDAVENADGTAGMHDCPECDRFDSEQGGSSEDDHDDCPECARYDAEQGQEDDHDGCPACEDFDAKQDPMDSMSVGQAHPEATDDTQGIHPDNCPECQELYADASENQPGQTGQEDPNLQGHETAEEVLDMLDQEPGSGTPPAEEATQIDNTEMPQGDAMDQNTSVKENFGPAQTKDVSDSDKDFQQQTMKDSSMDDQDDQQDGPDMRDVLQGGLDEHVQDQKKQQVVDMVAQTLQGFKANKEFLETAKEQSPGLYQSTIQMLKAMIALCDLLGLKPQAQPEQPPQDPSQPAPPAAPPAAPGAPAPETAPPAGGSPDPKAQGQV